MRKDGLSEMSLNGCHTCKLLKRTVVNESNTYAKACKNYLVIFQIFYGWHIRKYCLEAMVGAADVAWRRWWRRGHNVRCWVAG